MRPSLFALLALILLAPAAIAQSDAPEPQDAWMVHLDSSGGGLRYLPATISVVPGGLVQLMVFGQGHGRYSLTLDGHSGFAADVDTSESGIVHVAEFRAPAAPGVYAFHDAYHPATKGVLLVQEVGPLVGVGDGYDTKFYPARVEVDAGKTFRFQNNASEIVHTMTARDGSFDTDKVVPGEKRTLTAPTTPGEYPFLCKYHEGTGMMGVLVVRAASATPTRTDTPPPSPAPQKDTPALGALPVLAALGIFALTLRRR